MQQIAYILPKNSLWPWKQIQKAKLPLKVACFSWLLAKEAVRRHEILRKKNIILVTHCCLCGEAAETVGHLFLHCRITDQLWKNFINLSGMQCTMPSKIVDTAQLGRKLKTGAIGELFPACVWWIIWKERNDKYFEDRSRIVQKIKTYFFCFCFFVVQRTIPQMQKISQKLGHARIRSSLFSCYILL